MTSESGQQPPLVSVWEEEEGGETSKADFSSLHLSLCTQVSLVGEIINLEEAEQQITRI